MRTIEELLDLLDGPHRYDCQAFMRKHGELFNTSKGSATKHQPWPGGYRDHITEVMRIAYVTYHALSTIRPLPFTLSAALLCCFLHDIEKVWKHAPKEKLTWVENGPGLRVCLPIDKDKILADYFHLTDEHRNAIKYAHGEGEDYHPTERIQGPLGAFVHHCDNTSARIWFDKPDPHERSANLTAEYERLVRTYYPDHITPDVARRMLELEGLIFTDAERQTLVPTELRRQLGG